MSKKPFVIPAPPTILHDNLPLIEVEDPMLLRMILTDSRAAHCILAQLSERVAVVAPDRYEDLLKRLLQLGHLPQTLKS